MNPTDRDLRREQRLASMPVSVRRTPAGVSLAQKAAGTSAWTRSLELDDAVQEIIARAERQHTVEVEHAYHSLGLRGELTAAQTIGALDLLWETGLGLATIEDTLAELTGATNLDAELDN